MSEHSVPVRVYALVLAALLVLTFLTVGAAMIHIAHPWGDMVAIGIALTKATLVVLFFMHVKYSTRMTTVVILLALLFFIFLLAITSMDYLGRGLLPVPGK